MQLVLRELDLVDPFTLHAFDVSSDITLLEVDGLLQTVNFILDPLKVAMCLLLLLAELLLDVIVRLDLCKVLVV